MTDVTRHTRWSVAALLAPATAAVFAGTVGWASANTPAPAAPQTTKLAAAPLAQAVTGTDVDPSLESAVRAQIAQVEALRKQVADLRQQVKALHSGSAPKAAHAGTPAGSHTRSNPVPAGGSPAGGSAPVQPAPVQPAPVAAPAPAPQPAPVQVPPPAPAPAPAPPVTHTTTGGS